MKAVRTINKEVAGTMRVGVIAVMLMLSLLIGVAGVAAQDAPRRLSLDEAIHLGLDNSKALNASAMNVQYADAKASEINAGRLPSVKFSGSYTRLSDIEPFEITVPIPGLTPNTFVLSPTILNNYTYRASIAAPIFTGFKLENSVAAADLAVEAAQADLTKDRTEVVYAVKSAYWGLYKANEVKKVVDENVALMEAHLKDAQNLVDQGLLATNDLLKIEVQLSNTKLLQIDANNAVRVAQVNLNNLLGLPLPTQTEITTEIRHDPRTFGGWSSLVDTAVGQRADLQAMELRVKAGEASVSAARGAWWPQISAFGDYLSARPNPRVVPAQDIYKDTWDFGIQVSLDVWNWGIAAHQTAQAEAQLAQAKDAQGSLRDAVALEVTQNYLALQQAKEKIGVARQTIDQAEENSRITSDKFKEGLALTTDVLDADVALLQAKTNYTQSLVDYELAEGRLEKSLGEEAR